MAPTLADGDYVLALRPGAFSRCMVPGDVVVVDHPQLGSIVKRISSITLDGALRLAGDGALSTDSNAIGSVDQNLVRGRVCLRIPRSGWPVLVRSRAVA